MDQFGIVKQMGKYVEVPQDIDELTVEKIAMRVKKNQDAYTAKFAKKAMTEAEYYSKKGSILEK